VGHSLCINGTTDVLCCIGEHGFSGVPSLAHEEHMISTTVFIFSCVDYWKVEMEYRIAGNPYEAKYAFTYESNLEILELSAKSCAIFYLPENAIFCSVSQIGGFKELVLI